MALSGMLLYGYSIPTGEVPTMLMPAAMICRRSLNASIGW